MKKHDDGRINRDGITQGSGYGDTFEKARDLTPEEEKQQEQDKQEQKPTREEEKKDSDEDLMQ